MLAKKDLVFLTQNCLSKYIALRTKSFIKEQNIEDASFVEQDIDTFLTNSGLIGIVLSITGSRSKLYQKKLCPNTQSDSMTPGVILLTKKVAEMIEFDVA
ncbi:hypothetical protein GOBAR_AA17998 [Gossypium barbadense]|uniref:Uncharacterized protein n=1 Tax=Gossypium barbadense TaxID=3634 RepID=A0A2P5XH30_GOSBA|nr:hypothetical protein GOBAR_AA17998 [Gossypium barbadense]